MPVISGGNSTSINNIYCIHKVDWEIVNIINNLPMDVTITFDDCLYSQYYYSEYIKNQNRIYFCCPSLVNDSDNFELDIDCFTAMSKHFSVCDNSAYMNLSQIQELSNKYPIGGHSYYHAHIKNSKEYSNMNRFLDNKNDKIKSIFNKSKLVIEKENFIIEDTEKMIHWFSDKLKMVPTIYCFPYDNTSDNLINILKRYGFTKFFGAERIDIRDAII